jgi:hypothetical protein
MVSQGGRGRMAKSAKGADPSGVDKGLIAMFI